MRVGGCDDGVKKTSKHTKQLTEQMETCTKRGEKKSKKKVTPRPTWLVSCVTRELNPTEKTASRKWGGWVGGYKRTATQQRHTEETNNAPLCCQRKTRFWHGAMTAKSRSGGLRFFGQCVGEIFGLLQIPALFLVLRKGCRRGYIYKKIKIKIEKRRGKEGNLK